MNLPKEELEVLVKLDNGSFAVALLWEDNWYAGKGIRPSHEYESDILSGKVVSWSALPEELDNTLESTTSKPRIK